MADPLVEVAVRVCVWEFADRATLAEILADVTMLATNRYRSDRAD